MDEKKELVAGAGDTPLERAPEDPPVVARLVVEIRSDGTRTVARGAIEDATSGERVTMEARGSTPQQLALSLARSLLSTPLLAARTAPSRVRSVLERLLPGRPGK